MKINWQVKAFQRLEIEELYHILQLRQQVFVVEQNCPYLDIDGEDLMAYHLFATQAQEVVGYVRILLPKDQSAAARLGRLVVHPKARQQGLAKALMQRAMKFIQEHSANRAIELSGQCYLLGFYRSLGFQEVGYEYLEDGIPHHDMRWENS